MAVAITNSKVASYGTEVTLTSNPATSTTIDETEVFTLTPTGKDFKMGIILVNGAGHGAVTYTLTGGTGVTGFPALTVSVADGATELLQVETGRFMQQATGTIILTATPASGKRLLTDHATAVKVAELI